MRVGGSRERTIESYKYIFNQFVAVTEVSYVEDITLNTIYKYLETLDVTKETKLIRLKSIKAVLSRFFNHDELLNTRSNQIDPGTKEFNRSDDIEMYYTKLANKAPNTKSTKLKQLADSSGTEIRKTWAKMLDDKYKI